MLFRKYSDKKTEELYKLNVFFNLTKAFHLFISLFQYTFKVRLIKSTQFESILK